MVWPSVVSSVATGRNHTPKGHDDRWGPHRRSSTVLHMHRLSSTHAHTICKYALICTNLSIIYHIYISYRVLLKTIDILCEGSGDICLSESLKIITLYHHIFWIKCIPAYQPCCASSSSAVLNQFTHCLESWHSHPQIDRKAKQIGIGICGDCWDLLLFYICPSIGGRMTIIELNIYNWIIVNPI